MKAFNKVWILILLLTIAAPAMAQFKKGSDLAPLWRSYKKSTSKSSSTDYRNNSVFMGYVEGVTDALIMSDSELLGAIAESMTTDKACAIVGKYLDDHPEEWHLSGAVIVQKALRAAFVKKMQDSYPLKK
jgi:hypothetical protein